MRGKKAPAAVRFAEKHQLNEATGCWIWTGQRNQDGYGKLYMPPNKYVFAHRLSWEFANGSIPAGYEIDHLCGIRACVNPAHLEAVTHQENVRRGNTGRPSGYFASLKTHCVRGHEYTPTNTYIDKRNGRSCKECRRLQNRRRWFAIKDARKEPLECA